MIRAWFGAALLCCFGSVQATEQVAVCFNYGCLTEVTVAFSEARLAEAGERLSLAESSAEERAILAQVVGLLYRWAGEQSPIHADRPGDFLDDDVPGKMDCIDHAQTTTRMLQMLEKRGLLRFHKVDEVRRRVRWLVAQHFSAVIREKNDDASAGGALFVVDTWFGEHGDPAVVLPLEDWLDGGGPNVS